MLGGQGQEEGDELVRQAQLGAAVPDGPGVVPDGPGTVQGPAPLLAGASAGVGQAADLHLLPDPGACGIAH